MNTGTQLQPEPRTPNRAAVWFSRVVWLGIIFNLFFVAAQLFAPDIVNASMNLPGAPAAWNRAHGAMVLALSLLYIPAAVAPLRFPGYSWMTVVSRFIAVALWAWVSRSAPAFMSYLVSDAIFGVLEGVLLENALPPQYRITNAGEAVRLLWGGVRTRLASPRVKIGIAVIAVVVAVAAYGLWYNTLRAEPDTVFASVQDHFKHGAIGLGSGSRIPYWIFQALPVVCADKLPNGGAGGWSSLGLVSDGSALPVGFSKRHIGYDSVEANCALCHTGVYRTSASSKPELILGGPAHTLDLQGFQRFLYGCAAGPGFDTGNMMAAINNIHPLGFIEGAMYRFMLIPATRAGLMTQKDEYSWQESRPVQGRGRTDTFNPTKFNVFHMADDHTIGTTDLPQIWNQKPREGMYLHWDGNNNNIRERNYAAAMAIGATPQSVIEPSFKRVTDFLLTLQPPRFPFPVDDKAAARGQALFAQQCGGCHAFGGAHTGQVEPIEAVGTDRHRLDSFSAALVDRFHTINNPPFEFDAYRKTNGYANVPLDGIWARGPYLHNGSVPSLWALLQPVENRPVAFYRGYDVVDPKNVGFISDGLEAAKVGFRVDTAVPGNSNAGHTYGTALSDTQKWDLVEYLKTL